MSDTRATSLTSSLTEAVGQARQDIAKEDAAATVAATTGTSAEGEPEAGGRDAGAGDETEAPPEPKTAAEAKEFLENATAEEIAEIKANPVLSKLYGSMLRGFKSKTTEVAEKARALEEREAEIEQQYEEAKAARALHDAIRDNPRAMIKALAERNGMTIAEAKEAVEEATDPELVQLFGEDANAVKPLFDKAVEKRAKFVVDAALAPVSKFIYDQQVNQERQAIGLELKEFVQELKDGGEEITPEIERRMIALVDKYDQADGTSTKEYVQGLYAIATSGKSKAAVAKEIAERMARAARDRGPSDVPTGSTTAGTAALDPKLSFRESLAVARQEVRRGR